MNQVLAFLLAIIALSSSASTITKQDYSNLLSQYNACFILYSVNEAKIISEYNPDNYCNERISPDSTFKIPLSLMAFNQGIINQNTTFKWDGIKRDLPDWNQDLTPYTWLKYSSVWVSQLLTPQIGYARIKHYLAGFDYGNQDFTGDPGKNNGLTHAWLGSSLKISGFEQLKFLNSMLGNELPISNEAVLHTKKNMYLGTLDNGAAYYGKTGSGRHGRNERLSNPSKLRDGWFVGFIEQGQQQYIFISNLTDKVPASTDKSYGAVSLSPAGSQVLKPITLKLLNTYFSR
ncbi:penicillin-binding transpeptidase domain-containing protein [Legionella bononiensis]|uniref:Beta-lactamase n=1 Tax=Legionella bononiensis TaxID=2793102 RepID=A0ABS1WF81_9GAMM|nr:penicillin-binding transpeptidase domain-containing protein [Legionella bononiensis]MBL7479268.1 class D beta-lactamase [Legionella bononiensis]MBL7528004.1 class D beta-lactamase [Legionella bononiensis]MBL7563919.1 class D beta-lactamase [Legionella bononiensis]